MNSKVCKIFRSQMQNLLAKDNDLFNDFRINTRRALSLENSVMNTKNFGTPLIGKKEISSSTFLTDKKNPMFYDKFNINRHSCQEKPNQIFFSGNKCKDIKRRLFEKINSNKSNFTKNSLLKK